MKRTVLVIKIDGVEQEVKTCYLPIGCVPYYAELNCGGFGRLVLDEDHDLIIAKDYSTCPTRVGWFNLDGRYYSGNGLIVRNKESREDVGIDIETFKQRIKFI